MFNNRLPYLKVKPFDKNLIKSFFSFLSILSVIVSFILIFIDIPQKHKVGYAITFAILLIIVYIGMFIRANCLKKISMSINNSLVEIETGDIFEEKDYKIIGFNEFFDTEVDDKLISSRTLNGIYIKKFYKDNIEKLDAIIANDEQAKKNIIGKVKRKIGKLERYKLGTIIKDNDYFLLALSKFDKDNRAFLEIDDYVTCLINMWNECDIHYAGKSVSMPLLGSGLTRFRGYENISDQELLEIILWTFKASRIRFQYPAKLRIILTENTLQRINLYDIKKRFSK